MAPDERLARQFNHRTILQVGERPPTKEIPAPELAAWTSVARAILNLHETITRN